MTMEAITPQDHMACIAALQRFAMLVDAARYDEAADLFAVDGVLQRPDERIEGRAALLSSFKARPVQRLTRHILTNVLLEPAGPGRIRAFSYVSVYRHLGQEPLPPVLPVAARQPETIAEYSDELCLREGQWLLRNRTVRPVFDTL
ncbi:nuclear transport factor 2 family protein [Achromobacter anxifer]